MAVRSRVAYGSILSNMNTLRSKLRPPVPRSLGVLGACLLLDEYKYLTQCLHVPDSMFAGICGRMADRTLSLVFMSPEMQGLLSTRSMVCSGTSWFEDMITLVYICDGIVCFHVSGVW